jgi:hypothetical protein
MSSVGDGLPPVLGKTWPADDFAYLVALGRAGKPLVFSSLDELPPAANAARLAYQSFGMRSHVAQPLMVAGELVGFLGFGSLRRERAWPEDLLARMRLLAQIFAAALARKRAQEELNRAMGFERLLAELSASFIDLPSERLDDAIEDALRRIVQTLDIDRSTLALVDPLTGSSEFTHSYAVEGVRRLRLVIGQQTTHLRLRPGETIHEEPPVPEFCKRLPMEPSRLL